MEALKKFLLKNSKDAKKIMAPGEHDEEEIESPEEKALEHELGSAHYEHDKGEFMSPEMPLPKYEKGKSMLGKYLKFAENKKDEDDEYC